MTKKKKIILIIIGAVIATIAVAALLLYLIWNFAWKLVEKYELNDKTQTYIEAIIDRDNDRLHTVSYARDVDAEELAELLAEKEIVLRGEVHVDSVYSVNINIFNHVTTAKAIFRVTVGSERYTVTVEYVEDTEGSGIRSIFFK